MQPRAPGASPRSQLPQEERGCVPAVSPRKDCGRQAGRQDEAGGVGHSPSGKPCSLLAKDFLRFTWFLWSQAGCWASWPLAAAGGSLLCDLQSATARLWASVSSPDPPACTPALEDPVYVAESPDGFQPQLLHLQVGINTAIPWEVSRRSWCSLHGGQGPSRWSVPV